jgi:hypothetical protein
MAWVMHVRKNESTAAKRRFYFHLVDQTDGYTPKTGQTGQPQISIDGGAFADSGIGALSEIGNGDYYADAAQATVNVNGPSVMRARFDSANTREARADNVLIVGGSLHEAIAALTNSSVVDLETGHTSHKEADGSAECFKIQDGGVNASANTHTLTRA